MAFRYGKTSIDTLAVRIFYLTYFGLSFSIVDRNFFTTCRDEKTVCLVAQRHSIDIIALEMVEHLALALERSALVHEHLARLAARVKLSLHLLLLGLRVCATKESFGGTRDGSVVHTVADTLRAGLSAIRTAVTDCHEFLLGRF